MNFVGVGFYKACGEDQEFKIYPQKLFDWGIYNLRGKWSYFWTAS